MTDQHTLAEAAFVSCAVCQRTLPQSAAMRMDAGDYVLYFCQACCLEDWSADQRALQEQEAGGG